MSKNLIAIGRSRYLYDGIRHLAAKGYRFKAIVTEEAYEEYDIKHADFERLAAETGAKFFMIRSLNNEELIRIVTENQVLAAISANWKYTIPKSFLDRFTHGILNFHLGNLPDYKGNATVNWTIINEEDHIYGNIHKMDPELDAGDVIARKAIPIGPNTFIAEILKQAEQDVPALYEEALDRVYNRPEQIEVKGTVHGLRCYPRLPEDSQIDWQDTAENICRLIRASAHPYTGAYSFLNGEKITIWNASVFRPEDPFLAVPGHIIGILKENLAVRVACGKDQLEIREIGYQGKTIPPGELIKSIRLRFKPSSHA
ncbi:MAG TPA: formyltransferase family protein [Puia sp.]|nr:formyltransferase family protein [Puia sp.]